MVLIGQPQKLCICISTLVETVHQTLLPCLVKTCGGSLRCLGGKQTLAVDPRAIAKSLGSALTSEDATAELPLSAAASAPSVAQQSAPLAPAKGLPQQGGRLGAVAAGAHVPRDLGRSDFAMALLLTP